MTNLTRSNFQAHPFHLVSPSPWPIFTCIALLTLTTTGVLTMHNFSSADDFLKLAFISVVCSMAFWWRDVISEGTYLGNHTLAVQRGLNMGVALFIVSEALFFLAIFWAFFHSALSPTVELGAQWPPMGIEAINPFELPLLNTVILLSSGVTVTYAHHSLIQGNRKGALYGLVATVFLAIIFTVFQGVEYTVSSFTISDGAFGSCFYFGTGFHGLTIINVAPFININNKLKTKGIPKFHTNIISPVSVKLEDETLLKPIDNNKFLITVPCYKNIESKSFYLERDFIEWLVGFTDAEGNFHITLRDQNNDGYRNAQFTFQIGLHKDEEKVLNYIMNRLKCGHISKSGDRLNYFVNDIYSLLYIIIPLFNYYNLNSSKYHHFHLFKKAVYLTKDKSHLSSEGKLNIINIKKEMQKMKGQWVPSSIINKMNITKYWLVGFIDGEGSFSYNKYVPRFRVENHYKELELYNKIKEYIGTGNLLLAPLRTNKVNNNPTVVLEINKIKEIKDKLIPLFYSVEQVDKIEVNKGVILKTLKSKDFLLWLRLIDIYSKGYHTIAEGKYVFDAIKLHMNKYRLTSNDFLLKDKYLIPVSDIEGLLSKLYLLDSPYEIKQGIRYYRNTNKLVSEATSVIAIDSNNKKTIYKSISDCAKDLKIGRHKIKHCLNTGAGYEGYSFVLS
jgi:cytochrome c oxidase subunit 3